MKKNWLTWFKGVLIALGGAVAYAAVQGVIGNRADSFVTWATAQLQSSLARDIRPWLITGCTITICLLIVLFFWRRCKIAERAFIVDHQMVDLDDSLLRNLADTVPSCV